MTAGAVLALVAVAGLTLREMGRRARPSAALQLDSGPRRAAALGAVVAGSLGVMGYATAGSSFVWDDFVNLREAQVSRLSFEYLTGRSPGTCCLGLRVAPVHRLAYWFIDRFFPMNFRVAQVLALTGFALCLLVLHRLLAELFGAGPGPVVLTLLFALAPVHVEVLQWWSATLDRVGSTLFSLIAVLAYVRYVARRRPLLLAVSLLALAAALLFHTKPALVPLYLVLLRVLVLPSEGGVREAVAGALLEWRVWLAYVALVALYLVVYLSRYHPALGDPSLAKLASYLPVLWFEVLAPSFFGVYLPRDTGPGAAAAVIAVVQALVLAVVAWSIWRDRTAWRGWVFLLVALVANAVIVGLTRVGDPSGPLGPAGTAYVLRYNEEISWLLPIALGAAFLRRQGRHEARASAAGLTPLATGTATGLAGIAVAVYVSLCWVSAGRIASKEVWPGARARQYVDRVQEGLRPVLESGRPTAMVDAVTPFDVVPLLFAPYDSHSEFLPVVDERVVFDATERELFHVREDGVVTPVRFVAGAGGEAADLVRAGTLGAIPAGADLGDGGYCVRSGRSPSLIAFIPPQPVTAGPLFLSLTFTSRGRAPLTLAAEPVGGGSPPRGKVVNLVDGGPRTTVFSLEAGELQRVYLGLGPQGELCIQRLEVGRLALPT